MNLDAQFLEAVKSPIQQTWEAIAYDVAKLGGRQSNSSNMEMALDADRIVMYGSEKGKAADALLNEAFKEHGYQKVSRFLCKHIKLST